MTRDVFWFVDLAATLIALLALVCAYFRLGKIKRASKSIGMSDQYLESAVGIAVMTTLYAAVIVLFNLGSSWLVGPTASGVLLVDMIHTQTNQQKR